MKTFAIVEKGKAIRCNVCSLTSWNPNDVKHRYCGNCHKYHADMEKEQTAKFHETMSRALQIRSNDE